MAEDLKLPEELEECRDHIVDALTAPIPGGWPEDAVLLDAEQPEHIARAIIPALHLHLMNAKIAFLFKRTMAQGDKVILGKAGKASPELRFLADYDFVISFNWKTWPELTHAQRVAAVDHELSHCGYDFESEKYVIVQHDVEEFSGIVQRWGLWKSDLVPFGQACARQLSLFDTDTSSVTFEAEGHDPVTVKVSEVEAFADQLRKTPKKMRRAPQVAK